MEQTEIIKIKDVESQLVAGSSSRTVLKGINLTIEQGEIFAIVGRNGSGKTRLLKTIALQERPATGVVAIDNKTTTIMTDRDLAHERRHIGYVGKGDMLLLTKSVADNIALPLKLQNYSEEQITQIVQKVLEKVELTSKTNASPRDLNNLQRIKVEIARALATNPKILLCNDIFQGLEHKSLHLLANLLSSLNREYNLTIVLITNDAEVIKHLCNRVAVMHNGKIAETTSTINLFTSPESEVAKDFLKAITRHELPSSIRRRLKPKPSENCYALIRACFTSQISPEEILSKILQENVIKISIIQAYQETIRKTTINVMIIEMRGEIENITNACDYMRHHQLLNETIGYVTNAS